MISNLLKKFLILILFFHLNNLFAYENKILIKVDNKIITNYDLKNKILTTLILAGEEVNQKNIDKTKPLVLKSLIESKIKKNEVDKYKIKITKNELNNNLNLLSGNKINDFKNNFISNGLDYERYKKDLEIELAWRKLIFSLYNKKVKIDNTEIDLQLNKVLNQNKILEYRLTELSINFKDIEEKEKKIKEINQEIKELGFEKVVNKYSQSTNINNVGDLGWVNSNSLSKNIFDSIKNLRVNEVSQPIIMGNNFLYLSIKDKREVKKDNIDIDKLRQNILNNKKNQRFKLYSNNHLSKLQNLAVVEYQ